MHSCLLVRCKLIFSVGYGNEPNFGFGTESNMLYVETPIGVGFSYSNTSLDYVNWNDSRTGILLFIH